MHFKELLMVLKFSQHPNSYKFQSILGSGGLSIQCIPFQPFHLASIKNTHHPSESREQTTPNSALTLTCEAQALSSLQHFSRLTTQHSGDILMHLYCLATLLVPQTQKPQTWFRFLIRSAGQ